ncbi:MAG: hypothetical protein H3C34_05770 [Caldilineaceae bacterium]|nr:hypothetical protein [Caldilineaceae bacterium]
MIRYLIGIIIVLHGLVHLWYVVLARGLVEYKPEMGWSGRSWLFTSLIGDPATRNLASILLLLVTVALALGGVGFFIDQQWTRPVLIVSALASAFVLILFWDGSPQLIVQKGLIGLLIDAAIIAGLLIWP